MSASYDVRKLKLAETHLKAGRLDQARQLLLRFSRKHPRVPESWLMLASIYGQTGEYQQVVNCCQKVIAVHPNQPLARSLLGSAYVFLGNNEEALTHLDIARKLLPDNLGILNNLSNALYAVGKFDEAMGSFRTILQLQPGYARAHFGLGNCFLALGQWDEALASYRQAYNEMADDYDINMSLGKAYLNLGGLDEAVESFQRALQLADRPEVALNELAQVAQLQGHLTQALDYIQQSLALQPDRPQGRAVQAEINYKLGNIDEAHAQIRELLDQGEIHPKVLEVYAAMCERFGECRQVIRLAESLLTADNGLSRVDATTLHYSLGGLYDKAGEFDNAFEHYHHANTVIPLSFDRNDHLKGVNSLIAGYSREAISSMPRVECKDERPVFIVGMPRSGTSLVEQVLASHPEVFGAGELGDIKDLASEMLRGRVTGEKIGFDTIRPGLTGELANRYLATIGQLAGSARRVTDKMPANFMWIGFIMQLFPRARIIHCRRDPRDTCLSIYFQQFSKGHKYASDMGDLAFYYRQYERLMAHWRSVLDLPLLEISYADFVADLDGHVRKLIDFLGLEWDDRCTQFHTSRRATATASWDQVRQPIYTKSLARWKHYRSHLGRLLEEFGEEDEPIAWSSRQDQVSLGKPG